MTDSKLVVGEHPGDAAVRFARAEEFLASIDENGKRVGAIVFGTRSRPFKVNLRGTARGKFATWAEALECVEAAR